MIPDLGHLTAEIAEARQATADAAAAQQAAASRTRTVVHAMRAAGLSLTDCAAALGVSRGRISQLG